MALVVAATGGIDPDWTRDLAVATDTLGLLAITGMLPLASVWVFIGSPSQRLGAWLADIVWLLVVELVALLATALAVMVWTVMMPPVWSLLAFAGAWYLRPWQQLAMAVRS